MHCYFIFLYIITLAIITYYYKFIITYYYIIITSLLHMVNHVIMIPLTRVMQRVKPPLLFHYYPLLRHYFQGAHYYSLLHISVFRRCRCQAHHQLMHMTPWFPILQSHLGSCWEADAHSFILHSRKLGIMVLVMSPYCQSPRRWSD